MKNALFAMALMLVGAVGCGSSDSSSPMDKACDKLESCQTLSTVVPEAPTAPECKQMASSRTSGLSAELLDTADKAVNACLQKANCTEATSCLSLLLSMMPKN